MFETDPVPGTVLILAAIITCGARFITGLGTHALITGYWTNAIR